MSGNLNNDFENKSNLNTGDILLFRNNTYDVYDNNNKEDKHSYTNAVLIIKDPWFLTVPLKGLYVMSEDITGNIELVTLTSVICNHKWIDVRNWEGIEYDNKFKKRFEQFYRNSIKSHHCCSNMKCMHSLLYKLGCRCRKKTHRYKDTLTLKLLAQACIKLGLLPNKDNILTWSANDFSKVYIDKPYKLSDTWRLK